MPAFKNQHFVPRCLLTPFSHDGGGKAINLYNIRHDRPIRAAPLKGQCARDYFYGKDGKLEKIFGVMEGRFREVCQHVFVGGIDAVQLNSLKFFMYVQWRRTESAMLVVKELHEKMAIDVFEELDPPPLPSDHILLLHSLKFCLDTRGYIEDLRTRIIENRTDVDFVISDDPAILANRFAVERLGDVGFGIASSGVLMTMPLTPRYAVIAYDRQVYTVPKTSAEGRIIVKDEREVESLNEFQYLKGAENIYFMNWEHRDYLRSCFYAVQDKRPTARVEIEHLVPGAKADEPSVKIRGEKERYKVGTIEEARTAGVSLVRQRFKYPVPSRWFGWLKMRRKPKTFCEGTGIGHTRKPEWLRPEGRAAQRTGRDASG
jgi:hypothetical protein